MKKVILSLLLLLSLSADCAKAQGILWSTENYAAPNSVMNYNGFTVDKNGNAYVCGTVGPSIFSTTDSVTVAFGTDTVDTHGGTYLVVFCIDSNGNYRWVYQLPELSTNENIQMSADNLGGVYLLGNSAADSVHAPGILIPPYNSFLIKLNDRGLVSGQTNFGNGYLKMDISPSSNIFITGTYNDSVTMGRYTLRGDGTHSGKMFIAKLDSSLSTLWAYNEGGDSTSGASIAVANDSCIYVAGTFVGKDTIDTFRLTSAFIYPAQTADYLIARFDNTGHPVWISNVSSLDSSLIVNSIGVDANSNIYFSGSHKNEIHINADTLPGTTPVAAGIQEAGFLIKYNQHGLPVWGRAIDTNYTIVSDLYIDKCNNIWTRTLSFRSIYSFDLGAIYSFDSFGSRMDTFRIAGNGFICPDRSGNLYIAGNYDTLSTRTRALYEANTLSGDKITVTKYKYGYADCSRDTIPINSLKVESTIAKPHTITLYPNPATETCTLAGDAAFLNNSTAQVFDASGRLVTTYTLSPGNPTMDVSDLRPGVYLVKVTSTLAESVVVRLTVVK